MHVINEAIAISVSNLCFARGNKKIFENVSIAFPKGKVTGILGPSGTGKTTLLHLLGRLLMPQSGNIVIFDQDILKLSTKDMMRLRQSMGVLFQSGALFTHLNVFDNIAFPMRQTKRLSEDLIYYLVKLKLEAVGLRGAEKLMPNELSGGMARRIALARAVALDPAMMFYDEPFTGQDPISMGILLALIRKLNDALGLTSLVVSHDVVELMSIADYIVILGNHSVLAAGTPHDIRNHESALVQQFLKGNPDGPISFRYPSKPLMEDL